MEMIKEAKKPSVQACESCLYRNKWWMDNVEAYVVDDILYPEFEYYDYHCLTDVSRATYYGRINRNEDMRTWTEYAEFLASDEFEENLSDFRRNMTEKAVMLAKEAVRARLDNDAVTYVNKSKEAYFELLERYFEWDKKVRDNLDGYKIGEDITTEELKDAVYHVYHNYLEYLEATCVEVDGEIYTKVNFGICDD